MHITAGNVTINGFVLDGNNPNLPQGSATTVGVITTDSRRAIETEDASGNLVGANSALVENNIIQNYAQRGVELGNHADTSPATSGSSVYGNVICNFGDTGILLAYNAYGDVVSNTVVMTDGDEAGIWLQDFPNNGATPKTMDWSHNTVTVSQDPYGGIWLNLFYASAATINIHDNTVNAAAGVTGSDDLTYGIYHTSLQNGTTAQLSNNIVGATGGQFARGIALWNLPTTTNTSVIGGTVGNALIGVSLSYDDENFGGAGASLAADLSGLSISGTGIGVLADATDSGTNTVRVQISGNTVATGCTDGVSVLGAKASANIHDNNASITGNSVGVAVDTGVALLQNNDLTGNSVAGVSATNGAIVDAGTCPAANVTGLGISAGGNNLSYGFTGSPLAIINGNPGGTPVVWADHDNFGAVAGNNITNAFSGAVDYAQSPAVLAAPANQSLSCVSGVPAGATSLAGLRAQGGYYSAGSASVSFSDDTNFLGSGVIHRTYTVADACGVTNTAVQTITVSDTMPPFFTAAPTDVTYPADMGQCSKSNVTWVVTASDNCAVRSVISTPASGSTFPKGPTVVTTIATDTSGNTATNTFTVTVIDTQKPIVTVWPANATLDVNGQCQVAVPDLTTQIAATDNCDTPVYTQVPAAGTLVSVGVTNVLVTVSDLSSNSVSSNVVLTVIDTRPAPAATFVDAAYAGKPNGSVENWPNAGANGPHYIGCDAFATIQGGVNRVATNGTVNVAAGTYVENVSVNNAMTLLGANAGVDPRLTCRAGAGRGAEAAIDGGGFDASLAISANNVTVDGFTIQNGANGALNSGVYMSGGVANVQVVNNIVTNNSIGISVACYDACGIRTNLIIANNQNPLAASGACGILGYANTTNLTISDNEITGQVTNNPIQLDAVSPAYGTHVNLAVVAKQHIWQSPMLRRFMRSASREALSRATNLPPIRR